MYLLNNAYVKWKNTKSTNFRMMNGVKQGGVLSPTLFAVYLDRLLRQIHTLGLGCFMGNIYANAFAYADDVIILSPICSAMRKLIEICEQYSNEFCLSFNPNKCFLLVFCNRNFDLSHINLQLRNQPIQIVNGSKHLGHFVSSKGSIIQIDEIIREMQVKANIISNEFHCLTYKARAKIFNSQCLNLYGCGLWNLEDRNLNNLYKAWRKSSRKILKLHPRTHNELIPSLMDSLPIELVVKERWLNFFLSGLRRPQDAIANFFKNSLISSCSYSVSNINILLNELQILYTDIFMLKRNDIRRKFLMKNHVSRWKVTLLSELLDVREGLSTSNLTMKEVQNIINYICTQ